LSTSNTTEVDRPAAQVFAYVTDTSRFFEWQNGVVEGSPQENGPAAVGDRCVNTRRIGFLERPVTSEITDIDPPRTWSVSGVDGPIRATVNVIVDPLDGDNRSRVTITIDFIGYGIGKLLVPLVVRPQARKEMSANMQRLKKRLEDAV
jgi:uncharacterized protein YndB with AHSA1/START domain